jgi:hypothetical protein
LAENVTEGGYRLNIKNNQDTAVTIKVVLDIPIKDWNMTRESLPHQSDHPDRVYWIIEIPSKGEVDLKYRLNLSRG